MTKPKERLTPAIIEYCQRCSEEERKAIVAYCCYMAFADQTLRRMEVSTVRAIAEQMRITPDKVALMARKVRHRRMKIKMPKSQDARRLLFHLALRLAVADDRVDSCERSAIDRLAGQMRISADTVESELAKVWGSVRPDPTPPAPTPLRLSPDVKENVGAQATGEMPKGFFARLFDSLTSEWVEEDLEADLYPHPKRHGAQKRGELEYTLTMNGDVELEIELDEIGVPPDEIVSVLVAGELVCEITIPFGRVDRTMRASDHGTIPKVAAGDTAEILHQGNMLLAGQFRPN